MKIGLVCPYNMALGGAVQEIVKESYDELQKRGHEVVIISPTPVQGIPDLPQYRIIYLEKANDLKAMGTVAQVSYCTKPKQISDMLAREQFDVLHVHEPWVPLMNRQILRRAQCPVVATFHAKMPDSGVAMLITSVGQVYTKPVVKYIDEFVAVSEPAAEHISKVLGRAVTIIPNAINLSAFKRAENPQPIDTAKKTILYVGRLEGRKGVTFLLSAFKRLHDKHPDTQLYIGGKGPDMAMLEKQADDEGTGAVTFLGYLEDGYKKELLQRADLFVSPAINGESFGVILIEALASGQVVIAGDNPGYRSVMKGEGEQSLIDPRATDAFAEKLEKMLYDEPLRTHYRQWAAEYVKQFDYPIIVDQYELIYKELAAKGHGKA